MRKPFKTIFIIGLLLFICTNIIIKLFFIDIVKVQGHSMQPTFNNGTYLLISRYSAGMRCPRNIFEIPWVNTLSYYLLPNDYIDKTLFNAPKSYVKLKRSDINRKDVVIFNMPYYLQSTAIKRCIGMPGDSIKHYSPTHEVLSIIPYEGMRIKSGQYSDEQQNILINKYFFKKEKKTDDLVATTNFYFVLGDNSSASIDSRVWGLLPEDHIFAKVLFPLF